MAAKTHPGRRTKLSIAQRKQLIRLMKQGPRANGYTTDLWTLPRVTEVIRKQFGVRYDPADLWRILNATLVLRLGHYPSRTLDVD